jgi:predicted AlkP superfamily pyrophosphatase or phosphodiesterase
MLARKYMRGIFNCCLVFLLCGLDDAGAAEPSPEPRLVLLVVVDQLRGDLPTRFLDRFPPGGFRYFADHGITYRDARYRHATTLTAAGHATIATGGNSAEHGIVANDWRENGRAAYCVGDPQHRIFGSDARGISPSTLRSSTFGDELILASGGKSRVFSVSTKDRAAVLMGGHLGQAYWYNKDDGRYVSSTYYFDDLPTWLEDWNDEALVDKLIDRPWDLLLDRQRYSGTDDDRPEERSRGSLGRTFPHPVLGTPEERYGLIRYTPAADTLTLDFVKTLVARENVGRGEATDVLAVSFSATDYVGHAFGPGSLEAEDNLFRLDRTIAELLAFIDERVSLDRTLVVLTSDHGVDAIPEYRAKLGFDAARHRPAEILATANEAVRQAFRIDEDVVHTLLKPGLYFDRQRVAELGLDPVRVEQVIADAIAQSPGFDHAFTRTQIMNGQLPRTRLGEQVAASYYDGRSGDVVLVWSPFWFLASDPDVDSATHGSPHGYDTHVPIMVAGPGISRGHISLPVAPRDIAPTVAAYLGIAPPSGSVGKVLPGIVDR